MNLLPDIPAWFIKTVLWVPWADLAKGILIGIPIALLTVGALSWLLDWTAGRHTPTGPICDQCELEVDEVKPYELAGPGKHSPRLVCDLCAFRLIAADLQSGESPGFGRHADEALALVREADEDDDDPWCDECQQPPADVLDVMALDADLDDPYHPAGSCHLCAEPPDLSVLHEFDANRAKGDAS